MIVSLRLMEISLLKAAFEHFAGLISEIELDGHYSIWVRTPSGYYHGSWREGDTADWAKVEEAKREEAARKMEKKRWISRKH